MQLNSGTRVRRYEIESLLGRGGMGEVYRARDVELGRTVALKVLPHLEGDADERVRRFVQEAKAAVALNHPNVAHLYDAGEESGIRFIAMEYVEGETLRERMLRHPFSIDEALDVVIQIASALADAHAHGIVHRDIKPDNVMLRPDGYVKVLDFGLAKVTVASPDEATRAIETQTGAVLGTVQYMSPEQLRAETVDARTDIFSLGVLFYELLGGRRPFEARSPSAVIVAILTDEPKPLENVPPELNAIVMKALAKKREDRYATAGDFLGTLRMVRGSSRIRSGDVPTQILSTTKPMRRMPRWALIAIALVPVLAILAVYFVRQFAQKRRVESAIAELPRLEKLADERKYFETWDLAKSIEPLVNDARLGAALAKVSIPLSVESDPAGAQIFLQRIDAKGNVAATRELVGAAPIAKRPIAQGDYVVTIEKSGFATFTRTLQAQPVRHVQGMWVPPPPPNLKIKLLPSAAVPAGMVAVPGGMYRLTGWRRASERPAELAGYFIDRFEVSNADFARFVRDGGYRRRELWKQPIVKDGKTLSFEEAMPLLHDSTGLGGPRTWANGSFPPGREKYPVTDVTWYEAAAYAEWAGKRLPTIYEWDKAARNGVNSGVGRMLPWGQETTGDITLRANFRGAGPMPVDSLPSGMSSWGVYHLAGNVTEWLSNPNDGGFTVTGGAFDDVAYLFGDIGAYPGFFSSPRIGFRCAKSDGDQGGFALVTDRQEIPVYAAVGDAEFAKIRERYAYTRVSDAKVIETKETADWRKEKVTYTAAKGGKAILYLYLPKGVPKPYQVVHFVPAGDVARGHRALDQSIESTVVTLLRGGRGVFGVVLEGYLERERVGDPPQNSREAVEDAVAHMADLRRGLDYVASRPDIDAKHIGFYGPSAGAEVGILLTAIDDRYRAVVFTGAGLTPSLQRAPETSRINFAPHIAAPKLMLHGKYDEAHPFRTEGEPLYRLLRGEKSIVLYDGGHIPPPEILFREMNAFFDKHLGKP